MNEEQEEADLRQEDEERQRASWPQLHGATLSHSVNGMSQPPKKSVTIRPLIVSHVRVLGDEEHRELHGAVLGVVAGHELRLGLGQVERQPVRLGERRHQEDEERERQDEDVPGPSACCCTIASSDDVAGEQESRESPPCPARSRRRPSGRWSAARRAARTCCWTSSRPAPCRTRPATRSRGCTGSRSAGRRAPCRSAPTAWAAERRTG